MEKHINYMARTFESYRDEFLEFAKKYYPEVAESYNDSTIGSFIMDLLAGVGDNLSYSIDRMSQEQTLEGANQRGSVYNIARSNGIKVPGPSASICEVSISCDLPLTYRDDASMAQPNWDYAPLIKKTSIMSAGNINFQLDEDVNFAEQFNSDGYSNRTYTPMRNSNQQLCGYTVTKTAIAINGTLRVFKKVLSTDDVKPFMEVVLPDLNVMNIESIIFKETGNFKKDPDISEFYRDEAMFQIPTENTKTYRYFEVDSLSDQYQFGVDHSDVDEYVDYTETSNSGDSSTRTTRYYKGKWDVVRQKFITEFTDNGYMKITFGSGVEYQDIDDFTSGTTYGVWRSTKVINNDMLGVLPNVGWTMYVLYRVGGGVTSNIAPGAINTFTSLVSQFKDSIQNNQSENVPRMKGDVLNSIRVTNISPAIAGKDMPNAEELKKLIKYGDLEQKRCVTLKDYKARVQMMPPKFGTPFRVSTMEENNKIIISLLNIDAEGKLSKSLPETLVNNIVEYLSHYKTINDYLELRSGRIYNIGISVDLFISKNYNTTNVVSNVINTVNNYMAINNHDMGEDIFIGDLEKEISLVDGVINIIDLSVYCVYNGSYSTNVVPFDKADDSGVCGYPGTTFMLNDSTASSFKINLNSLDKVLTADSNSMFEIKYPEADIQVKCKIK